MIQQTQRLAPHWLATQASTFNGEIYDENTELQLSNQQTDADFSHGFYFGGM